MLRLAREIYGGPVHFLLPHEAEQREQEQEALRREFAGKWAFSPADAPRGGRPFVILDGGELILNEHHTNYGWADGHVPHREGFSVLLYFETNCHIHQAGAGGFVTEGEVIFRQIGEELVRRCEMLVGVLDMGFAFEELGEDEVEVAMSPNCVPGFNNGEIYVWFKKRTVPSALASRLALALFESVETEPVKAALGGVALPIKFHGSGFRLT